MKKLTLNKIIISNLTKQEAGRIKGGGITDNDACTTEIWDGCNGQYSEEPGCSLYCSNGCSGEECVPETDPMQCWTDEYGCTSK